MRFLFSKLLPLFLLGESRPVKAVLYGDEQFLDVEGGKFWAFYHDRISVIDPETCEIEKNITHDHDGNSLPSSWNDGVYMEYKNDSTGQYEGYLLAGSRVDRTGSTGESVSDIYAISTTKKKVIDTIETGARIVHSYGVYTQNEFWAHSDADGHFYVVNLADLSTHTHKVSAKVETPHHGKLLWDEDPAHLANRGFATSTGEPFLFELDLATKKQTLKYDFSGDVSTGCTGLHAIAYSALNRHVYCECSGGGGTLEFDVADGITFVHQHLEATGALYEIPDGTFVVASNKGENKLHVFIPSGQGKKSSVEFTVNVPGRPSTVSFLKKSDFEGDYIACMPLTENLNQNQIDDNGVIRCDYYNGCTGATTAADVDFGVCYHDTDSNKLVRQTTVISESGSMPNCRRCEDSSNFQLGECICTPECAACDSNPAESDAESGYVCVDLGDVVSGSTLSGIAIKDMGGVHQGRGYGGSPECSYGRTYRAHKRGARKYDASVANVPTDSIQILNMETRAKHCEVLLGGPPSRVLYAPSEPVGKTDPTSGAPRRTQGQQQHQNAVTIIILSTMLLLLGAGEVSWYV